MGFRDRPKIIFRSQGGPETRWNIPPTAEYWNTAYLGITPTWSFDNGLYWPGGKFGDTLAIFLRKFASVHGKEYTIRFTIVDYDQNGAISPQIRFSMGIDNARETISLDGKPGAFSVEGSQVADNSSLLAGEETTYMDAGASAFGSAGPIFKITGVIIYES